MPTGGRQGHSQSLDQVDPKSISPLISNLGEKGARIQTFCAKLQWRNRRVIDSVMLHHLQAMAEEIFLAARHAPTGKAPWKIFHRKSFSFGDTCSFQILTWQSKGDCGKGDVALRFFFAVQYPELVEYSPDLVPDYINLSAALSLLSFIMRIFSSSCGIHLWIASLFQSEPYWKRRFETLRSIYLSGISPIGRPCSDRLSHGSVH